jgi:phenylacetate-coenzyme A ligase PaaK-like adenylate-forming protein
MTTRSATPEYWEPNEETLPLEQLEQLQGLRLSNTVDRV